MRHLPIPSIIFRKLKEACTRQKQKQFPSFLSPNTYSYMSLSQSSAGLMHFIYVNTRTLFNIKTDPIYIIHELTNLSRMDFPTLIRRINIFPNLGVVVFFDSLHSLIERSVQQTAETLIRCRCDISSGSALFAYDVPQKDIRLIWE